MRQLPKNLNKINPNPTPVNDYLTAKYFKQNRTWSMIGGLMVTFFGGAYLTSQEWDELYPTPNPISFNRCYNNQDTTKNYLL